MDQSTITQASVFRRREGQHAIEWAVLLSVVVIAITMMKEYLYAAMKASAKTIELQLNGAMRDNRP